MAQKHRRANYAGRPTGPEAVSNSEVERLAMILSASVARKHARERDVEIVFISFYRDGCLQIEVPGRKQFPSHMR